MRFAPFAAASLALLALTGSASASVTEPNGDSVPNDSSGLLAGLFAAAGDPINVQADASTTPNSFSPLCGFTATFVLHEAGFNLGLAWYNETGSTPQGGDLHVIIPPNSPIGQTFTGTDIKNDPSYLGGTVGFAIVGEQTHYTNPAYNPMCDFFLECSPSGPWIMALIYPSKKTPNAYYIAFEDGAASAFSFSNDGDFNDDVYLLTGIACAGGGAPCETGLPGICGPGLTQCTANGPICIGLTPPAPMETCNGIDDDCNGQPDDGKICPDGFICDKGTCVQDCQGGEFNCPPDKVCNKGYCVDPTCQNVDCPSGQVCIAGICKGPCDGVVCPLGQVCRVGACVDPCANVVCEGSQVCDNGVCIAPCDCQPCAAGEACNATSLLCVDPPCAGTTCTAGMYCQAGVCVDACTGAVCPAGQLCAAGVCSGDPNATSSSSGGEGGSTGVFGAGVGGEDSPSGPSTTAGAGGAGGAGGDAATGAASGCGCRVAERDDSSQPLVGIALAMLLAARRRRR